MTGVQREFTTWRGKARGVCECAGKVGPEVRVWGLVGERVVLRGVNRDGWGVVEVDVEKEGLVIIRVAFLKFPCYGAVTGTYIVLHDFTNYAVYVCDFADFGGRPVV